ncbi:Plexin domain-containing protein 1 [Fragariocoptes setiger]|uniref:Plexin domain-containing protein 1 n=1 Tax=Fragariocoptes setiger TaxID=1670756 RepID=A0ABQ7SBG5_9ACAR|nr:Plexin domain-containing protein 1 [Fragariocoptes setiger]
MTFPSTGVYLDTLRECYEAFVIYSFMKYLLNFLHYDTNLQQYIDFKPVIRPITTFLAVISQVFHIYGEGNYNPLSGYSYPWLLLINNMSQILAMYCLVIFYTGYKRELQPMRPLAKSVMISLMIELDIIKSITKNMFPGIETDAEIARKLQDFLICIEMLFASIAHHFAYTHIPFIDGSNSSENESCCLAFWNTMDMSDERNDVADHLYQAVLKVKSTLKRDRSLPTVIIMDNDYDPAREFEYTPLVTMNSSLVRSGSSIRPELSSVPDIQYAMLNNSVIILIALAALFNTHHTASGSNDTGAVASPTSSAPLANQPLASGNVTNDGDADEDLMPTKKDEEQRPPGANETKKDDHSFYRPEYITDHARAMSYWLDFSKLPANNVSYKHELLSKSHRRAAPINLTFDFPYYGQPIRSIIVATGGFLYLGDHLHHWLAATQNISPLMANFDLSTSNDSDINHYDNGSSLVVQWNNVQMKDHKPEGNFSFQVTLLKNGDIIFVYKHLPVKIQEIPEDEHPVKVGISDAFLIDKLVFFIRRKTIYDYHRLNLKEQPNIGNETAIYLTALPTCIQYDTCESCAKANSTLDCVWCPSVKRCSNGFDRKRQEWLTNHCDNIKVSNCTAPVSSLSPSANSMQSQSEPSKEAQALPPIEPRVAEKSTALASFLMLLALVSGVAIWVFYAYKNPQTSSGQLLIKYRPGNWRWQTSEGTRYTAASIHM